MIYYLVEYKRHGESCIVLYRKREDTLEYLDMALTEFPNILKLAPKGIYWEDSILPHSVLSDRILFQGTEDECRTNFGKYKLALELLR